MRTTWSTFRQRRTVANGNPSAAYLRDQRNTFLHGRPAPYVLSLGLGRCIALIRTLVTFPKVKGSLNLRTAQRCKTLHIQMAVVFSDLSLSTVLATQQNENGW